MYALSGLVVHAYEHAVRDCGFKLFWGADAKKQAPEMPDLHLHETAVSWIRYRLERTLPCSPWKETVEEFSARLKEIALDINENLNVEGLCWKFPGRVNEVIDREGDRLFH